MSGSHSHTHQHQTEIHDVPLALSSINDLILEHGNCQCNASEEIAHISTMMLESVCNGILLIDAERRTIVYANDAAANLIGAPKESIIGHICHKFTCPADQNACPLLDLGETINQSEKTLLSFDGRAIPIIKTVIPIHWHSKQYLVESFTDISQLKEAQIHQEELMQKLEGMNQELTDFAYIVSHDLKAPLRGIKSLADWIVCDHSDSLNDEGKQQLALLQNRVDRMQDLINGILEYSRLGQVSEHITDVDLNVILPDIIDMLAIPDSFTIVVQESLPTLRCEKTRLSQIFQNLLSNAVKYMDKPDGHIEIACSDQRDLWTFSIKDNGPGIERQFLDKIFQLFQTLQSKDESDSTGIGLSVVKKSVTMYGGEVWVESELGKGSTFFISFPKSKVMASET